MKPIPRDAIASAHVARSSGFHLTGLLAIAFLTVAASTALARAPSLEALQQRLGVTRVSLQSLRFDSTEPVVSLELDGQRLTIELERSQLRSPGFRVLLEGADGSLQEAPAPEASTYRGTVPAIPGSVVGGTIRNGMLNATIALGDGRLFHVQPLLEIEPGSDADLHAIYDAADLEGLGGTCAADELPVIVPRGHEPGGAASAAGLYTAEIAFDTDFEYFVLNNGNYTNTVNEIQNIMSQVNAVFERDCGITHYLTQVIVRTTPSDPYTSADPSGMLNEFRNHWNAAQAGVPRDVAHLMTGKELDGTTIGIAFLGAVCNRSRAYGLSQTRYTTNMGRRVALTAHELGHNWNASHCDAVSPCYIMCSGQSFCDGIGLPSFEPMAIDAITSFAASRTCFGTPVAVDEVVPGGSARFSAPTPSPFTDQTGLSFYLDQRIRAELEVFDITGQRVARLVEGIQSAGWHQVTWRGRDQTGRELEAGVYYARLQFAGRTMMQKLVLLR